MKPNKQVFLKNLLSDKEQQEFFKAIASNPAIRETLIKIIDQKIKAVNRRDDLLDDPNYCVKRPYLDGRYRELLWFKSLLTSKEDSDESRSTGN